MKPIRIAIALILTFVAVILFAPSAWAFCGFYVSQADTKLYNNSSQVILARDGNRTILTMANDYQGDVKDFALVVPVPVLIQREQVNVGNPKIIERLDAFSAPRLVEYFDPDPCRVELRGGGTRGGETDGIMLAAPTAQREDSALGVTVEARFTVGEYEIVILSAKESNGLETWLVRNGYKIPQGAKQLLQPYIRQNMKFFVAKVNLGEFAKSGYQFLRPLQIAYESPRFMLPIRLGTVNATNEQDLIIYILSPKGQAEVTNYRTVKVPSDVEIPVFVKNQFGEFYKAMFNTAYTQEGKKVAFLEYAWDMSNCDPCSAPPLSQEELRQAGVFWLNSPQASNVFITRLHVRYTRSTFPEDLMFQETSNRQNFQGRYILRHPFAGEINCEAGQEYKRALAERVEKEAQSLAKLTGWNMQDIRQKVPVTQIQNRPFWRNIWP